MNIAVIPARGGSKRIPRKNIKNFCGKPMIAYAIEVLTASRLFEHVIVSTDDEEIAELSSRCGAKVPFVRPANLSNDEATTDNVLLHAVEQCQNLYGPLLRGCCVYPTNPFLTQKDLEYGLAILLEHEACCSFPVVKYDFPIEQAFVLEGVRPRAKWGEMLSRRSQDFIVHYHDAGMFYWFDVAAFANKKQLFCDNCVAFPIPRDRCQDINTPEDWARAELKYRMLNQSS
jgi:N-acylneuraminate cytidylyltransferase